MDSKTLPDLQNPFDTAMAALAAAGLGPVTVGECHDLRCQWSDRRAA